MASRSTDGLYEAVGLRFEAMKGCAARGFNLSEISSAILAAILRGDPNCFEFGGEERWADIPQRLQTAPYAMSPTLMSAVETAALVEDHVTGYADEYQAIFPVQGVKDWQTVMVNQRIRSAVGLWVWQETMHAERLGLWHLMASEDPVASLQLRAQEAQKVYTAPSYNPVVLFLYTAIQERATQLFYSLLLENITEPILRAILRRMALEESQHAILFTDIITKALPGADAVTMDGAAEMLQQFSMPLSGMLDDYRMRAVQMRRSTNNRYDYKEAFGMIGERLNKLVDAKHQQRSRRFDELVETLIGMGVSRRSGRAQRVATA